MRGVIFPWPPGVYEAGRDFGYDWANRVMADGDCILLDDLEGAIFEHLISDKALAPYTAICRTAAEKAARRVFGKIGVDSCIASIVQI